MTRTGRRGREDESSTGTDARHRFTRAFTSVFSWAFSCAASLTTRAYGARGARSQNQTDHRIGQPAVIWGTSIVGFGMYLMTYANGKTGEWPVAAFAARAGDLTIYGMPSEAILPELPAKLGKVKRKGGCMHIERLADVDLPTLTTLIRKSIAERKKDRIA